MEKSWQPGHRHEFRHLVNHPDPGRINNTLWRQKNTWTSPRPGREFKRIQKNSLQHTGWSKTAYQGNQGTGESWILKTNCLPGAAGSVDHQLDVAREWWNHQSRYLQSNVYNTRHNHDLLCHYTLIDRSIREFYYSAPDRCTGHSLSQVEHAFILGHVPGQCRSIIIILSPNRNRSKRVDLLPSFKFTRWRYNWFWKSKHNPTGIFNPGPPTSYSPYLPCYFGIWTGNIWNKVSWFLLSEVIKLTLCFTVNPQNTRFKLWSI